MAAAKVATVKPVLKMPEVRGPGSGMPGRDLCYGREEMPERSVLQRGRRK